MRSRNIARGLKTHQKMAWKRSEWKKKNLKMALDFILNENLRLVEELRWWRRTNNSTVPPSMFLNILLDNSQEAADEGYVSSTVGV